MIILRQNEYASTIRKLRYKIGRTRTKISDKLIDKIDNYINKSRENSNKAANPAETINDPKIYLESIKEAKKHGARTMTDKWGISRKTGGYFTIDNKYNRNLIPNNTPEKLKKNLFFPIRALY